MRISEPDQIRKPIPLTPLVDIVFLLLMFFMLSSTFTKFSALDISASSGGETSIAKPTFPGVIIVVDGQGSITINGAATPLQGVASALDDFAADGAKRAALRAGGQATVQDLVTVLEAVRSSRIASVTVVE